MSALRFTNPALQFCFCFPFPRAIARELQEFFLPVIDSMTPC